MIFDQNGNPVSSFSTSIESETEQIYNIQLECRSGYSLYADEVSDILVEAKRTADLSWVNIETTPIDLTAWANTTQDFQLRLTAGTTTTAIRRAFSVRVAHI